MQANSPVIPGHAIPHRWAGCTAGPWVNGLRVNQPIEFRGLGSIYRESDGICGCRVRDRIPVIEVDADAAGQVICLHQMKPPPPNHCQIPASAQRPGIPLLQHRLSCEVGMAACMRHHSKWDTSRISKATSRNRRASPHRCHPDARWFSSCRRSAALRRLNFTSPTTTRLPASRT